ncbi:MAG: macro domain-containing protein, partial [Proteobacteria bacterium]|nr:macro domain-containing protein [Pseudomonadota bacterium]
DLPARHVIHTVGPVWRGGDADEDRLLADCYRNSLALARRHGVKRIAFPAISTGVYGFPPARAAAIAVRAVRAETAPEAETGSGIEEVIFVCFGAEAVAVYEAALAISPDCG